ncbi:MAG TPA: glycosyltransferase family 1 protein [Thermoanaerobaculia bacterium]|nr:glycosyltransferase family 1 protein [Thermoanaerobaculia bacterium]
MNVLIDGRALVGNRTGIGVHTAEIARRLDTPPLIASHTEIADKSGLEHCAFRVDEHALGVLWQQWSLPRIDGDVLWGPHGTLPMTWRKPSVVTMHDFTSITMPGRHRLKTILAFNLFIGRSLEQASRIACVSRAVADETMRGFGVAPAKIELVPNGVDEFFSPGGIEQDYILFTGTLEPRKGVDDLIAVWQSLSAPRPRLVLCGDAGWKTRIPKEPGIEVTGYVTRKQLRELYRGARVFVYPSRYEGFGIPPLEAMACGAAVIATRTGAIPEFGEGAALLIAPGDRGALRAALVRVLGDRALRDELRARGPERAKLWTWDRSARVMMELLRCA